MNAYSLDLREKIVFAYEEGKTSIRKVAERFQVSKGVVQNLINLKRRTGEIRPKKATGGRKSQ
jgi:putative transposase